jgi:hypothetical protein
MSGRACGRKPSTELHERADQHVVASVILTYGADPSRARHRPPRRQKLYLFLGQGEALAVQPRLASSRTIRPFA